MVIRRLRGGDAGLVASGGEIAGVVQWPLGVG